MAWKKLPEYTGDLHIGCLNCSTAKRVVTMRTQVRFVDDTITRDGVLVYQGDDNKDMGNTQCPTLMRFENMARKDPDHDWRYEHYTAMHGELYQRQGKNQWVLVDSNKGWA